MTLASTVFKKTTFQKFSHSNAQGSKFVGQGPLGIISLTNLVGPTSSMLHTKSQGHWPSGIGEEDFLKVFTIYGHGGHLCHVTKIFCINFG